MATKTITIMDDAYELLASHKRNNESFSDVIRREMGSKKDISKFIGMWKDIPKEEIEKMKESINKRRKLILRRD